MKMMDVILPVPVMEDDEVAEITLKMGDNEQKYQFRIETYYGGNKQKQDENAEQVLNRLERLKSAIMGYDNTWELIQVYAPDEETKSVKVLYRKKI